MIPPGCLRRLRLIRPQPWTATCVTAATRNKLPRQTCKSLPTRSALAMLRQEVIARLGNRMSAAELCVTAEPIFCHVELPCHDPLHRQLLVRRLVLLRRLVLSTLLRRLGTLRQLRIPHRPLNPNPHPNPNPRLPRPFAEMRCVNRCVQARGAVRATASAIGSMCLASARK